MRKYLLWAWLICLTQAAAIAQETNPKPINWKDIPTWKYMPNGNFKISPNGQWIAYATLALEGDGEITLQKTNDQASKKTFPIGATNFAAMEFSENSQWFALKEYPNFSTKKAKTGTSIGDKLILLKLGTDTQKTFEKVSSFAFNGRASTHLALTLSSQGKNGDAEGSDLLLYHLNSEKKQNLGNVLDFAFNKIGNHLAYTVDAANKSGNGLYLLSMNSNAVQVLDNDEATYKSIVWTEKGDAFTALKMVKDTKYKQNLGKVIGVKNLASPQVIVYDPAKDSVGFPREYTISANKRPIWSEDLTRIFYGIHPLVLAEKEKPKKPENKDSITQIESIKISKIMADTTIKSISQLQKAIAKLDSVKVTTNKKENNADKPDMTIWHWQDTRLQSRQQMLENQDKNFSYWAMYEVASQKHTPLQDSSMLELSILPKEIFALGSDLQTYELESNLNGQSYRDYYSVNLKTGERKSIFTNFYLPSFASAPRSSPDGTKLLYGKDGHYFVYDLFSGISTNLTADLPVSFVNLDDDHNVEKPLQNSIGWSSDSKYVLIRDGWDIWQVPLGAKEKAINLTLNGRKEQIRYQYRFGLDPDEKGIDLTRTQYFKIYGEWTKKSGVALLSPAKTGLAPGAKSLIWEDANIGSLQKAKQAPVYYFSKETFTEPTQIYLTDATLANPKKATESAPDASKYSWSAGTRLVNYISDKGDTLQGVLFLPAGYLEGKKYPTVVYYYEKLSQTRHNWSNPAFGGTGWNPTIYTSNGFAVFIPDIVYKMDDPGMSAVWCVIPAVKAAIATGIIDEQNIGIHGHSWGGYQTSFLITQTNMFKAAAAGAPLTNMISMYDLIYWNTGNGNMSIFEASQGRFKGGPWENWEAYERNSPVYHVKNVQTPLLMLHNDKDGAVDFTQGIEYYNALRRLKKPVILIQYKGENHGLGKLENRKDYSVRMMEFFDHHLKGLPAPDWMQNGVKRLKLDEHLEERAF